MSSSGDKGNFTLDTSVIFHDVWVYTWDLFSNEVRRLHNATMSVDSLEIIGNKVFIHCCRSIHVRNLLVKIKHEIDIGQFDYNQCRLIRTNQGLLVCRDSESHILINPKDFTTREILILGKNLLVVNSEVFSIGSDGYAIKTDLITGKSDTLYYQTTNWCKLDDRRIIFLLQQPEPQIKIGTVTRKGISWGSGFKCETLDIVFCALENFLLLFREGLEKIEVLDLNTMKIVTFSEYHLGSSDSYLDSFGRKKPKNKKFYPLPNPKGKNFYFLFTCGQEDKSQFWCIENGLLPLSQASTKLTLKLCFQLNELVIPVKYYDYYTSNGWLLNGKNSLFFLDVKGNRKLGHECKFGHTCIAISSGPVISRKLLEELLIKRLKDHLPLDLISETFNFFLL